MPAPADPGLETLALPADWPEGVSGAVAEILCTRVLPAFLPRQRWYAGKGHALPKVALVDWVRHAFASGEVMLAIVEAAPPGAPAQRYALPLALAWDDDGAAVLARSPADVLARVQRGAALGVLYDATAWPGLGRAVLAALRAGHEAAGIAGSRLEARPTAALAAIADVSGERCRRLAGEQSNTSLLVDDRIVIKIYRRLQAGVHPEIEIGRFLTEVARFRNAPRLLGSLELVAADGAQTAIALVQEFIANAEDCFTLTLKHLERRLGAPPPLGAVAAGAGDEGDDEGYGRRVDTLARRLAELHRAFALPVADPAFAPEATTAADIAAWNAEIAELAARAGAALRQALEAKLLDAASSAVAERLLAAGGPIAVPPALTAEALAGTVKSRIHGDLHLGQAVLAGNDIHFLDFEGEPLLPLEERRRKASPLRDVAGLVRSFDYAGNAVLARRAAAGNAEAAAARQRIERWRAATTARFLAAYRQAIGGCPSVPADAAAFAAAVDTLVTEKALYEVCYEAAHRPEWLAIPLAGLARLLAGRDERRSGRDRSLPLP